MRLLNVDTFQFHEFHDDEIPPYLVTSHRWSGNEATYKDVLKRRNTDSDGYRKIESFCAFVRQASTTRRADSGKSKWIWLDTCCINQNSSAEVSESINSMWGWYSRATHCIAYLRDVRPLRAGWEAVMFDFRNSEWFERGWTLQELLAPPCVVFVTQEWEVIGRKSNPNHRCSLTSTTLDTKIAEVTGIPEHVLCTFHNARDDVSKEVKMAWAANRRTTKAEDAAYCLLGIFDVHMPLIYGEGERNARRRLGQEIMKREQERHEFVNGFAPEPGPSFQQYDNMRQDAQNDKASLGRANTPISSQHDEVIRDGDLCPICKLLLLEPVLTTCNHQMCESCLISNENAGMAVLPLDSEGEAEGDAAMNNFRAMLKCPVCDTVDMDALPTLSNETPQLKRRTEYLTQTYPQTYTLRAAQLEETDDPRTQILTILVGNWHRELKKNHHHWSFFVKPSRTDIIQEVHLQLHESFPEPHVICPRPPYSFHGEGWGYFTIEVLVVLVAGYSWLSNNAQNGPNGAPGAALKMDWTIDFQSFAGRGAMGKCRVKVRKVIGPR